MLIFNVLDIIHVIVPNCQSKNTQLFNFFGLCFLKISYDTQQNFIGSKAAAYSY